MGIPDWPDESVPRGNLCITTPIPFKYYESSLNNNLKAPIHVGIPEGLESREHGQYECPNIPRSQFNQDGKKETTSDKLVVCSTIPGSHGVHSTEVDRCLQHRKPIDRVGPIASSSMKSLQAQRLLFVAESERHNNLILEALEIQDKIMEKIQRKRSKRIKLKKAYWLTLVLSVLAALFPVVQASTLNGPALFDKDQKMDKLISKNQIAYHFKKNVREVTQ